MKRRGYVLWVFLFVLVTLTVNVGYAQSKGADDAMNPKAAELYNKGNELMKAGNYTDAIQSYNAALNIEKDYRTYYQKGIALKKANKLDEAKTAFEDGIKANPDFDLTYNGLGSVYFAQGDMDAAIKNFELFEQKTKKANLKETAKEYIARSFAKKGADALNDGSIQKAIEFLTKAVSNNNYDAAYLSLAKAYVEDGQNDKAIEAANNALKYRESISKGGPYYYLGLAYKNKGDNTKAAENFKLSSSDATYKKIAEHELSTLQ